MGKKGFWYWMTLSQPETYWLAKSLGGQAAQDADEAMNDMAPAVAIIIILFIIIVVLYFLAKFIGLL